MRKGLRHLTTLLLLLLLVTSTLIPALSKDGSFVLLHINDFHGKLKPFKRNNFLHLGPLYVSGYYNIATVVNDFRKKGPTLYLNAGDMITGSLLCDYYHGTTVIDVMNLVPPDVATIGNHEFDWGVKGLNNLLRRAKFDIVLANVYPEPGSGVKLENIKPFVVKNVGGVRVGIIGVTTTETPHITMEGNTKGLRFIAPEKVVSEYGKYLQNRVDVLIVLSHLGYKEDKALARKVDNVDLIVGGHSHTKLKKPTIIKHKNGKVTYIVQAYKYGMYIGRGKITVKEGKVSLTNYNLLPVIDDVIPDNPETKALTEKFAEKLAPISNQIVATLSKEYNRYRLTRFSAYIAKEVTGADIGFMNTGGIRRPLGPGKVTYEQLFACFPFPNHLVVVELSGKELKKLVSKALRRRNAILYGVDVRKGRFDNMIQVNGKPIDDNQTYKIATVDFLARGGDGYTELKNGKIIWVGPLFRDVMREHLQEIENFYKSKIKSKVKGHK